MTHCVLVLRHAPFETRPFETRAARAPQDDTRAGQDDIVNLRLPRDGLRRVLGSREFER